MNRAAFTIWELLAVIVTILIVLALMLPVYYNVRQGTYHGSCITNQEQLARAIFLYAQDNDGSLPDIADAANVSRTWRSAVYPYAKNKNIYQCPSRDDKSSGPDGFPKSYAANYTGNYGGGKDDFGDGAFAGPGSRGINVLDIPAPQDLIMLCEVVHHSTPEFNIDNLAAFDPHSHFLYTGHSDGSNYLFVDGHVKFLKPPDTKDKWHRDPHIPLTPAAVGLLADAHNGGWE